MTKRDPILAELKRGWPGVTWRRTYGGCYVCKVSGGCPWLYKKSGGGWRWVALASLAGNARTPYEAASRARRAVLAEGRRLVKAAGGER